MQAFTLLDQFGIGGTLRELAGNDALLVTDPTKAWIVQTGRVDLFLVQSHNGEPAGAREHVVRITDGQAIFGMDVTQSSGDKILIAAAAPGTQVLEVPRTEILRAASAPGASEQIQALLQNWIATLSSAAVAEMEPKVYQSISAGSEILIPKEPKPVLPTEGLVWLRHLEGQGRFLGHKAGAAINGDYYFPLASPAWLQEEPQNRLEAVTSDVARQRDPEWRGLEAFHQAVMVSLVANMEMAEQKELSRLARKLKADATRLDFSLRHLTSPLRLKSARGLAPAGEGDDPMLVACQAIGNVLGIEFKLYPGKRRDTARRDPVAAIAKASGVRMRRVVLSPSWWKQNAGPLLSIREGDSRPMALLPRSARSYDVYDPVEGTLVRVTSDIAATLEPFAFTFYRPFPPKPISARELITFGLKGSWGDVFVILLMGVLTGLLGMATPILTGTIFDTIIPGAQRSRLLEIAVFLGAASLSGVMFQLTRGFAVLRVEGKMDAMVQAAVWDRLLNLPVPFFRQYSAGDLAMRGLAINSMRQVLTGSAMSSIFSGIFSVFNFILLFYYSPKMALLACGLTLVALLVTSLCGFLQVKYQREVSKLGGQIAGMILQFILGVAKFRVSGTENRAFAAWAGNFSREKMLGLKSRSINNWLGVFNSVFPLLSSIAIFWMMAYLMSKPDATPLSTGKFLAFNAAYGQFASNMLQLTSVFVSILTIVPVYERAKPILNALPEVDPSKTDPGELTGNIEISHISFRYHEDRPLVLKDVSASIRPGEFVAFVGPSGSGKSTLFRLLLGFERPESGAIYFDGQDLAGLDVQNFRQQMGVVLQNASLFSGDIYTNIACSAPATIDEAWEAARLAGFEKDLKQMPMGMHTVIGDGGTGLSGGQRQRLMVARAVVGKPRILLFDEATSALDNQTQEIVSRSLEEMKATRIVIAHRLSTIINADKIFVIENGCLVQSGTYKELIQQDGLFAQLAKRQLT